MDIFEGLEKESESLQNRTQDLNKRIVSVEETLKVRLFVSSHRGQERASNFELEISKKVNKLVAGPNRPIQLKRIVSTAKTSKFDIRRPCQ